MLFLRLALIGLCKCVTPDFIPVDNRSPSSKSISLEYCTGPGYWVLGFLQRILGIVIFIR